jgi:carboxyl-terminal processing protease
MEKQKTHKHITKIAGLGLLVAMIFFFGFYTGRSQYSSYDYVTLKNKEVPIHLEDIDNTDFEVFWDVWKLIDDKYPNAEKIAKEDRVFAAVKGLVDGLGDDYSSFFDPVESEYFSQNLSGEFGGVGMEVGVRDGLITVITPLKDSPAYKAGLLAGDIILEIDGEAVGDKTIDEVVKIIRGEKGTEVTLTIYREGEEDTQEFTVVRDTIEVPTIRTDVKDGVFIIELFSFSESSPTLFREALQEFIDSDEQYLILDLRGNPGGYLEAARDMASWFLPEGKTIVTEEFANGDTVNYRSKGYDIFNENLKFVVLVDGGSASASEILAGAFQDYGIAEIVGAQTFGKGSVQEFIPIRSGGSLKITVANWLTPEGISISEGGLTPDVEVEFIKEEAEEGRDSQLEKAIEVVKGI